MNATEDKDWIYRTTYWEVRLNPNQKYLGRSAVVLKRPCPSLSMLIQEEILDFFQIVRDMETLLQKTFGATMFNWACSMNNAYQVSPPNPRVHWHVIPRYSHPVEFHGQIFRDDNFGYRSVDQVDLVSDEIFAAIVNELRSNTRGIDIRQL